VGPDDVLEISIFEWEMREETKTLQFRVSESGMVSLPALGSLAVAEKTVQEIQSTIEKELSTRNILQNPRVGVSVREFRSRRIAVVGEVNAPGVYAIHQNVTTFADVLTLAGGPTAAAGQIAYVLRFQRANSAPLRIVVDLQELLDRGSFELNAALKGGDVIYVPRAPLVFVYGTVRQPGAFALNRSMRVLEAIALAGGFAERADKRRCTLTRRTEGSGQVLIPLDIAGIERGTVPNPYLRDGDVVAVPISLSEVALVKLWEAFRGIFTFTYQLNPNN
jgi:polysaccharide export outer membrane protein